MAKTWHLNSFRHLKEHSKRPFARFLRTTLWQKCCDTFMAFIGKQQESFEIDTVGLFDYLSLGLSLCIHQLFLWSYQNYQNNFRAVIILIPSAAINALAWTVKAICSAILTICCLPIIFICHQISLITGGDHFKKNAFNILGTDQSSKNCASKPIKLKVFLERHQRSLAELNMELTITAPSITSQVVNKVSGIGRQINGLLPFKKDINNNTNSLNAHSKLTFLYYHPETKNFFSTFSFFSSSVFLISMFPWLAAFSAKKMATSATQRVSKAIIGGPKDLFEVIIDMDNQLQQKQISSIFKLNISEILNELYKAPLIEDEANMTASQQEMHRLTLIS